MEEAPEKASHCFFGTDHPFSQLSKPAPQSKGLLPWLVVALVSQPLCVIAQHHDFFGTDHPASQLSWPAEQS